MNPIIVAAFGIVAILAVMIFASRDETCKAGPKIADVIVIAGCQ